MYGEIAPSRKTNKVGQSTDSTTHRVKSPSANKLSFIPDQFLKENGKQRKPCKDIKNLKLAFSEYYLMLVLLQKYQLLNFTGFVKILKKHDKLFQTNRGYEWR